MQSMFSLFLMHYICFDQQLCFVAHSLYTKQHNTHHVGTSYRAVPFVAMHWSCSVGLLCKHYATTVKDNEHSNGTTG